MQTEPERKRAVRIGVSFISRHGAKQGVPRREVTLDALPPLQEEIISSARNNPARNQYWKANQHVGESQPGVLAG